MKILYFGGQKSGKSRLAEKKILEISKSKPYYIATYDNSFSDIEMQRRVLEHQRDRSDRFITIEESKNLSSVIEDNRSYIIDCLSMWILNTIDRDLDYLIQEIEALSKKEADIVFVLNDVQSGVIPVDKISREYIDRSGIIGQRVAMICDEVYEVKLGLEVKLK